MKTVYPFGIGDKMRVASSLNPMCPIPIGETCRITDMFPSPLKSEVMCVEVKFNNEDYENWNGTYLLASFKKV